MDTCPYFVAIKDYPNFTVSAGGTPPLRYQWERSDDAGTSWKPIAGASGTTYNVASATLAWADTRLRVVVSNVAGAVASAPVALKVQPSPRLLVGQLGGFGYADGAGGQARFNTPGAPAVDAQGNIYVPDASNAVIRKVTPTGVVSTYAGRHRQFGAEDGPLARASFYYPNALAFDAAGNLYVAEYTRVRKITPAGMVSTVAGGWSSGSADGVGSGASFSHLNALVADAQGNLVVADAGQNQVLRRISKDGVVSTLAGTAGDLQQLDGQGGAARFQNLSALALHGDGTLFVADRNSIRRVSADGQVSLYAGTYADEWLDRDAQRLQARFYMPVALGFDRQGRLYVGTQSGLIRRIDVDGSTYSVAGAGTWSNEERDGVGGAARLYHPAGLALMADGEHLVFAARYGHVLRKFELSGRVSTLAGLAVQEYQAVPGITSMARLGNMYSLSQDAQGRVLVATGFYGHPLLRLQNDNEMVNAGLGEMPDLYNPGAATRDAEGNTYFIDRGLRRLVKVGPNGVAKLHAGNTEWQTQSEHRDGQGAEARFGWMTAVLAEANGTLYVADSDMHLIRKITPGGLVSTIAGKPGVCGNQDGAAGASLLCWPAALAFDNQGRLLVAESSSHTIRRLESDGRLVTIAGVPFASGLSNGQVGRFSGPNGLAVDALGNIYVSDHGNAMIRRITPEGFVSVVMGDGTLALQLGVNGGINQPKGVLVRPNGRLIVATEQALISD